MLSQVKKRLLQPSFMGVSFLESLLRSPPTAYCSSKSGPPGKPSHLAGISKSAKVKGENPGENSMERKTLDELFRTDMSPSQDVSKAVSNQGKADSKTSREKLSGMKPRQLKTKMAEAAKNVAARAGENSKVVQDDLTDKINEAFNELESHRKKGNRKIDQRQAQLQDKRGEVDVNKLPIWNTALTDAKRGKANKVVGKDKQMDFADISDLIDSNVFTPPDRKSRAYMKVPVTSIDALLSSEEPLGIFSSNLKAASSLKLWPTFEEAELQRCTQYEPTNWFDQCIVWTKEGKLWQFPINNEQGMDDEAEIDFTEHIFLDNHIESWCPKEGPIRHFMELVLVGLSKNPYLSVVEKRENLEWYHQYFMKHQALLEEINAFGSHENPIQVDGTLT